MKKIDEIIKQISTDHNLLILIDELARTTNPQEGAAIVSATLEILQENSVCAFITTHYDITTSCKRLTAPEKLLISPTYEKLTLFLDKYYSK